MEVGNTNGFELGFDKGAGESVGPAEGDIEGLPEGAREGIFWKRLETVIVIHTPDGSTLNFVVSIFSVMKK
jgi:hypothetical protein